MRKGSDQTDRATEAFVVHRNLLFTVAYEMLGSAADAEDVLQDLPEQDRQALA
jgi:DNA-directed RNA polymerase specialized sigma24 family protein